MITTLYTNECRGEVIIINGNIVTSECFDPGIMNRGLSVYEVLRVKDKTPLFLEDHIERLYCSARITGAETFPSEKFINKNFHLIIENNQDKNEGNIKLLLHFPSGIEQKPDIYCYYVSHYYPSEKEYTRGVPVILENAEREKAHAKVINMKLQSSVSRKIKAKNAYEALLVNKDGFVTEGSKSNVFMISNKNVVTPPEKDVLPGITRKYIIRICRESGIDITESKIHYRELNNYQSCFITGTSPGVLAVKNIGTTVFDPENEFLKIISAKYQSLVYNYIALHKNKFNKYYY